MTPQPHSVKRWLTQVGWGNEVHSVVCPDVLQLGLAQEKPTTVYFNGHPIKGVIVTAKGGTYVKLPYNDLKKAGALVEGGSKPISAIQGCLGQTLFNGVTRVTLLEAGIKDGKYQMKLRIANGTNTALNPASDADMMSYNWYAANADGQVQPFDTWDDDHSPNNQLTPGANLSVGYLLNTLPKFKVTRLLYRLEPHTVQNGPSNKLPFAPVSNMDFAGEVHSALIFR